MMSAKFLNRTTLDRVFPRCQAKQQHSDAVDVALFGSRFAAQHFRRDVERRARQVEIAELRGRASGTKVHQDVPSAAVLHDVLRLDVTVQQSGIMYGAERSAYIYTDAGDFG